jgi:hypothetical protein
MICAFALSCVLTVLGSDPTSDAPVVVLRSYDLRGVVPTLPHRAPWLSLLPYDATGVESAGPPEYESPDATSVADAILNLMGSEFEYEGRGLHVEDGRLVVAAPREVHERVQRALATFEQAFSAGTDVIVDVITLRSDADLARLAPSAVIGTAEAERLIADLKGSTERASSHRMRLTPGRSSVVDLTRQISFLRDYDVEIAQRSGVPDPVVGLARVGMQLVLRGAPSAEGVTLALLLRHAELQGEVRKREFPISSLIGSDKGPVFEEVARDFQSPDVQFRSLALNSWLREGQELIASLGLQGAKTRNQEILVIRLAGDRAAAVQTLRVETAGGEGTRTRELTIVDAGLLSPPAVELGQLTQSTPTLSYATFPGGEQQERPFLDAWMREVGLDAASSMFQQTFPDQSFAQMRPLVVNVHEVASGDGSSIKLVAADLASKEVSRSITLMLKCGNRGARICLPVRLGEASGGMLGVEQLLVSDYDVDVADAAAIPNPITQAIVDGLGFWLRPTLAPSGDLSVELKVKVNFRADDGRETEIRSPFYSKVDLPSFDTLWLDERLTFGGATKEITLGDAGTSLVVRVD